MTTARIYKFDGGLTNAVVSDQIGQQTNAGTSGGFDIFKKKFGLTKPRIPSTYDTQSGGSEEPIFDAVKRLSDGRVIGAGQTSSSSLTFRFYRMSGTGTWQQNSASGIGVSNGNAFSVLYKEEQYGVACGTSQATLYRYDSDSAMTTLDTISDSHPSSIAPAPVVHSQDNTLYYAYGKTVRKYVSGASGSACITLPDYITSICEYGTYLAIACQSATGGTIYLWGRDTSLTTFQDKIPVDTGYLKIIDVIDGYLTAITESPYEPNFTNQIIFESNYAISARMYSGGTMKLVAETQLMGMTEGGTNHRMSNRKQRRDGCLFFHTGSNFLYRFGMNRSGQYVLSRDQQIAYSGVNVTSVHNFFLLGEYTYCCQSSSGVSYALARTENNGVWTNTAIYETTVNPAMFVEDWHMDKVLKRVSIKSTVLNASSGASVTVKYSVDGGSYVTLLTQSNTFPALTNRADSYAEVTDSLPLKTGKDFKFRIEATGYLDVEYLEYEYDNLNI